MIPKQFSPLGGKGSPGYSPAPFNAQPLPEGGAIVPYHSPLNPGLGQPHSQPALPPAGGSTPPNGIQVQPNTFTNIKPNRGEPFNPNPNGAKGNVNGNGGGGGVGVGLGGLAGGIASAGEGTAAAGGGIAAGPIIAGAIIFGLGIGLVYKEAEKPDSIVFKTLDVIDRKLKGGDQYKLENQSNTRSTGGVEISPEILPFPGGQTNSLYGVQAEVEVKNYNPDGSRAGRSTCQPFVYVQGPIGGTSIKSDGTGTGYYLAVKGKDGAISKAYLEWADITGYGFQQVHTVLWLNIFRADGTSKASDQAQGGNPAPLQVGTSEPRMTTSSPITKTNNPFPSPPPFADPAPKSWPPPPAIKPDPIPKPTDKPAPIPKPTDKPSPIPNPVSGPITNGKPNIAPGSYPAPAPNSPTSLGPAPSPVSGTASGSSGPTSQSLPSPIGPAPFADPPKPGNFTALPIPVPAPATSSSPSPTSNLTPVNNGQVTNAPQTEQERQGFPVEETGGSCCALPAIQSGNNQILDRLNALNNAGQNVALAEILARLGPQVEGGLSGWLGRFSRSIRLDRIMNLLSVMLALHNAAMLSRSLVDSISYLIDSTSQLIGLKDEDDTPLDLSAILGKSIESFLSGLIGAEIYQGLSTGWKKLSAIYTAAVNIYEMTLSSMAGLAEGLEIIGEYTGKVGNALKKGGAVLENAYQWMDENIHIKTGRLGAIQRVADGLESAEAVTSNLTEATEEIREVQENVNTIKGEFKTIQDKKTELETLRDTLEKEGDTASTSPSISKSDLNKPEN